MTTFEIVIAALDERSLTGSAVDHRNQSCLRWDCRGKSRHTKLGKLMKAIFIDLIGDIIPETNV